MSLGMFVTYFLVTFCDLTLTYSGMTFVLTHFHFQTFTNILCEFELLAARLTDTTVQNVKKVFYLEPYLHLTHDLYLKMLNIHQVCLDERFRTPPHSFRYDA